MRAGANVFVFVSKRPRCQSVFKSVFRSTKTSFLKKDTAVKFTWIINPNRSLMKMTLFFDAILHTE